MTVASSAHGCSSTAKLALQQHQYCSTIVHPPIQIWDPELADIAQEFAELCIFDHNPERHEKSSEFDFVGENLAATTKPADYTALVQLWYDEVSDYTFSTGECTPGRVCEHYTQVKYIIPIILHAVCDSTAEL